VLPNQNESQPEQEVAPKAPAETEHQQREDRHTAEVVSLDKFRKK
jgi:hypothetical protein